MEERSCDNNSYRDKGRVNLLNNDWPCTCTHIFLERGELKLESLYETLRGYTHTYTCVYTYMYMCIDIHVHVYRHTCTCKI